MLRSPCESVGCVCQRGPRYRAVLPRFTWSPAARTLPFQFEHESGTPKYAHREPASAAPLRWPPTSCIPYEPFQDPRPLPEYPEPPIALTGAPMAHAWPVACSTPIRDV